MFGVRAGAVLLACVVLAILASAVAAQTFQVGKSSDCSAAVGNASNPGQDVCLLVENKAREFGVQGRLQGMPLQRTNVSMSKGSWVGGSSTAGNPGSFWGQLSVGFTGLLGTVSYAPTTGPLANEPVQIQVGETGSATRRVKCVNLSFFSCETPETLQSLSDNAILGQIPLGIAIVQSHPVILKIINQTDQPLSRSTQLRLTGFVQDTGTTNDALAKGIAPLQGSQQGQAYYHLYRDQSVANNATVSYQFAAGGTGVLTGAILNIDLSIGTDGVAKGTCSADQGLLVNLACSVAVLGEANEGPVIAVVSVAS
jgi:hypothetical protein